jgi:hypothetical protein
MAQNIGTKGINGGEEAPPKRQDSEERNRGIPGQAMSIKIDPNSLLDMFSLCWFRPIRVGL